MKISIGKIKIGNRHRKDLGELDGLAKSMASIGLLHPVVLDQAYNLIAGQRRLAVAKELGWSTIDATLISIDAIILGERDENAQRKDFNPSEWVAIKRACIEHETMAAKERQTAGKGEDGSGGRGKKKNLMENLHKVSGKQAPTAKDKIAKAVGTSRPTLDKAEVIVKAAEEEPEKYHDLVKKMDNTGKVSASFRELNKRKRQESIANTPSLPDDKYRIIYADPPWHYDNKGMENYGHAEIHYNTMTVQELCALPVGDLALADSVLFIWVTSPLLPDVFDIIKSWGFTYKSSFVWDKIKHNYGHYNSVRHEFLLICTRGSCTPDNQQLFDSVQSIERSKTHSQKPSEFRTIIDTIYPSGKRIELFAREQSDNWEIWGNEAHGGLSE